MYSVTLVCTIEIKMENDKFKNYLLLIVFGCNCLCIKTHLQSDLLSVEWMLL